MAVGGLTRTVGRGSGWPGGAARWAARQAPGAAAFFTRRVLPRTHAVTGAEISARLDGLRAVFDAVQLFVAPSASVADAHAALGLDRSKVRVSDYGLAGGLRRAGRTDVQNRPIRIGFVGTLVWHKGAHVLLEAAQSLPSDRYELELWGSLETFPDYVRQLRVLARDLPARLCGGFDPEDAQAVYDRLDVLVVPSLWPENSPLVIHEAFMAGVPVVGARIGGIPELVSDGVSGVLYDPGSSAALSAALRSLIDDPARIARMAAHAPPVKTIEDDARDWERRYETLLGTPS
jgi:glycosyltransferase involved in cell wall biosynthesis